VSFTPLCHLHQEVGEFITLVSKRISKTGRPLLVLFLYHNMLTLEFAKSRRKRARANAGEQHLKLAKGARLAY
jgi:hypothetical protein